MTAHTRDIEALVAYARALVVHQDRLLAAFDIRPVGSPEWHKAWSLVHAHKAELDAAHAAVNATRPAEFDEPPGRGSWDRPLHGKTRNGIACSGTTPIKRKPYACDACGELRTDCRDGFSNGETSQCATCLGDKCRECGERTLTKDDGKCDECRDGFPEDGIPSATDICPERP